MVVFTMHYKIIDFDLNYWSIEAFHYNENAIGYVRQINSLCERTTDTTPQMLIEYMIDGILVTL